MVFPDILRVEDDDDFAFIMDSAFKQVDKKLILANAKNGREAMIVLKQYTENKGKPSLILLDFNLPGMSGIDLLKEIRTIEYFNLAPIIIFSTSDNPKKAILAMESGASSYQIKPIGYLKLINCLKNITDLWLR